MLLVIHCVYIVECYYHYYSLLFYLMAELTAPTHISGFCYIVGHISVGCISLFMVNQLFSMATTLMEHFWVFKFNKGQCNFIKHVADQGH